MVLPSDFSIRIPELLNSMQPPASKLRTGGTVLEYNPLLVVGKTLFL